MSTRDDILNKLRAAQRPFPDAPPRPQTYLPVTSVEDESPRALLARFEIELLRLSGEVHVVQSQQAASAKILDLLAAHGSKQICAWHFKHIPVKKLHATLREADYSIIYPDVHQADPAARARAIAQAESAGVGLTGVDAVAASTGTLIVRTGPGRGRLPTILPPVHIAVARLDQFVPRLEDWLAAQRKAGSPALHDSANLCFISGPSRTADIEKQLVLGVHGPKQVQVVVIC